MTNIVRFREFVRDVTDWVNKHGDDEAKLLDDVKPLLADLIGVDDWLSDAFAGARSDSYAQYLLHCDPLERLSVVSFVWGPGEKTPIHDHTVWGLVGVLRGEEVSQGYSLTLNEPPVPGEEVRMRPGDIEVVSPRMGDVHKVWNGLSDRPSISIHVYGANIGAVQRHVFDPETGAPKDFVSGYTNGTVPNLWDRSQELRAAQ